MYILIPSNKVLFVLFIVNGIIVCFCLNYCFVIAFSTILLLDLRPGSCLLILCSYITICLNFDLNSEISNREVIAFHRQPKICWLVFSIVKNFIANGSLTLNIFL